jgi:XTP/dITP diphosphohydrolase
MASLLIPHEISMPKDFGLEFSFDETEPTFIGNTLGKADHLFNLTGKPSIADDSGLVVDALDGAPGIFSARYGTDVFGRTLDSSEKNRYLLDNLKHVPRHLRTARFVCAMALVVSPFRRYVVQETVEGYIADKPFGDGGFGYDPVFLIGETDRTMAELTDTEKNAISHRGLAARSMLAILDTIEQKEVFHVC